MAATMSSKVRAAIKRDLTKNQMTHPQIAKKHNVTNNTVNYVFWQMVSKGQYKPKYHLNIPVDLKGSVALKSKQEAYYTEKELETLVEGLKYASDDLKGDEKAIYNGGLLKFSQQELRTYLL